jgi:signal transduction histidine kinase
VALLAQFGAGLATFTDPEVSRWIQRRMDELKEVQRQLREFAAGIYPQSLHDRGLAAALESSAERWSFRVSLDIPEHRFSRVVEESFYRTASEALTNAGKYAHASVVHITVSSDSSTACCSIMDDGVGGAKFEAGHGLVAMRDTAQAIGGNLEVSSGSNGRGTTVKVTLPCES